MRCNQKECSNAAAYRFTWPGHDESYICADHVGKLAGVAKAMGFPLQIVPLAVDELKAFRRALEILGADENEPS